MLCVMWLLFFGLVWLVLALTLGCGMSIPECAVETIKIFLWVGLVFLVCGMGCFACAVTAVFL